MSFARCPSVCWEGSIDTSAGRLESSDLMTDLSSKTAPWRRRHRLIGTVAAFLLLAAPAPWRGRHPRTPCPGPCRASPTGLRRKVLTPSAPERAWSRTTPPRAASPPPSPTTCGPRARAPCRSPAVRPEPVTSLSMSSRHGADPWAPRATNSAPRSGSRSSERPRPEPSTAPAPSSSSSPRATGCRPDAPSTCPGTRSAASASAPATCTSPRTGWRTWCATWRTTSSTSCSSS